MGHRLALLLPLLPLLAACGESPRRGSVDGPAAAPGDGRGGERALAADRSASSETPSIGIDRSPPPLADQGTPGKCAVPAEAQAESTASPTTVVGNGTAASCTSAAFVAAVAAGGVITFNCGASPVVITLDQTAKIFNDKGPKIVIDGGGKVTLSGGGKVRILYQNTCDQAQHWTTSHCDNQDHPLLTVQNLTFVQGNAKGLKLDDGSGAGGGAIFARGGRLKVVSCKFENNVCDDLGPDVGGGAIRAFDQHGGLPLYVVNSSFGGSPATANVCANGGGLSSIGVSWTVVNSLFAFNQAIGNGASSGQGGNGGAIYNDGDTFTLTLCGVTISNNTANEGGGAVFFVSNDLSGTLVIQDSTLTSNPSGKFETAGYPGIFYLGKGTPQVSNSTVTK
jgi:hypothetical protein